jgi:hypothetical protein
MLLKRQDLAGPEQQTRTDSEAKNLKSLLRDSLPCNGVI